MRSKIQQSFRALVTFAAVLGLGAGAAAESGGLQPEPHRYSVAIDAGGVVPDSLRAPAAEPFQIVNESSRSARVVFERRSADAVDCVGAGTDTGRRGQYLLSAGASLSCTSEAKLTYTVLRQDASGGLVRTKARVDAR